jgi:multiple antibiotic resistance protein
MLEVFVKSFAALFVALDVVGAGPLFLILTEGANEKQRHHIASEACFVAFIVLIIFAIIGNFFFKFIGVTIDSLKIAGGILLFVSSINMLLGKRAVVSKSFFSKKKINEIIIYPLSIPMIAGPSALTSTLLLVNSNFHITENLITVLVALAFAMISVFIHMYFATKIAKYTAKNILDVFSRVFSLVLAALAIQFIINGIKSSFGI